MLKAAGPSTRDQKYEDLEDGENDEGGDDESDGKVDAKQRRGIGGDGRGALDHIVQGDPEPDDPEPAEDGAVNRQSVRLRSTDRPPENISVPKRRDGPTRSAGDPV